MPGERKLLTISGSEARSFLQGLVTNDIDGVDRGLVYCALLTPQGKYLADFFVTAIGDSLILDADAVQAPGLAQRLTMYKLRADVTVSEANVGLARGTGSAPEGALADPRHPDMGWRLYAEGAAGDDGTDWDAIRVAHCIPEAGTELKPDETYILEAGFERLKGVDFRKGCYVGQEVTARMKHKTELRKGFATVEVSEPVPMGTPITAEGKPVGTLHTQSGGRAIAYLRFDRAEGDMSAGPANVRRV